MSAWTASWICGCQNRPAKLSGWAASWIVACQNRPKKWAPELHLEYLDVRTDGRGCAHELRLEYVDVRADRRRRARERHLGNYMSEQTNEGARMHCILSICMSEQTKEGERINCILSIWMSEQTEEGQRMNCILSKFGSQNRPKKVSKNVEVYSPRPSPGVCGRNKTTISNGGIRSLKVPDQVLPSIKPRRGLWSRSLYSWRTASHRLWARTFCFGASCGRKPQNRSGFNFCSIWAMLEHVGKRSEGRSLNWCLSISVTMWAAVEQHLRSLLVISTTYG